MRGVLCLEDGFHLEGELRGGRAGVTGTAWTVGEVVFTTGMTGYEDILTDPSYSGQILVFSFPMLGNYGVPGDGNARSVRVYPKGVVTRDLWEGPVGEGSIPLTEILDNNHCPVLTGVDTRSLVIHLREHGTQKGVIAPVPDTGLTDDFIGSLIRDATLLDLKDLREDVAARELTWLEPLKTPLGPCALMDFGAKPGLKRALLDMGFRLAVLPPGMPREDVLALEPAFVVLSGGPGSPDEHPKAIETVRGLWDKVPVYGIGLGHLVMARAAGAGVVRLKCGHYGANHPVKELATGKVLITSQNHALAVDAGTLPPGIEVTHRNANDGTVEGIRISGMSAGRSILAASVQFELQGSSYETVSGGLWSFLRELRIQGNSGFTLPAQPLPGKGDAVHA